MKISVIQLSTEWFNPSANLSHAEDYISQLPDSTLVVLPEMFATGFNMNSEAVCSHAQNIIAWSKEMSQKYQLAIGMGVAAYEEGRYYNRFYIVEKSGKVSYYNKRHLFSYAHEDEHYDRGSERVIVTIEGVRILLQICYDLRFPTWSRNNNDYDVAIYIACWPASRRTAWDTLLRARAIENIAYVCGCNVVGCDPSTSYSGGSAVIDFRGDTIDSLPDNREGVVSLSVDMERLAAFRAKFPALEDRDFFSINI